MTVNHLEHLKGEQPNSTPHTNGSYFHYQSKFRVAAASSVTFESSPKLNLSREGRSKFQIMMSDGTNGNGLNGLGTNSTGTMSRQTNVDGSAITGQITSAEFDR